MKNKNFGFPRRGAAGEPEKGGDRANSLRFPGRYVSGPVIREA